MIAREKEGGGEGRGGEGRICFDSFLGDGGLGYMLQVKIEFRLKLLTLLDSQFSLPPSPDYS